MTPEYEKANFLFELAQDIIDQCDWEWRCYREDMFAGIPHWINQQVVIDYSKDWCVLCNSIATKKCRDYHTSCIEIPQSRVGKEMSISITAQDISRANGLHTPLCFPVQKLLCGPWVVYGGNMARDRNDEERYEWIQIDRTALLILWKWTNHQHIVPTSCKVWIPEYLLKGDYGRIQLQASR